MKRFVGTCAISLCLAMAGHSQNAIANTKATASEAIAMVKKGISAIKATKDKDELFAIGGPRY
jgi:hypothetical protein